MKPWPFLIFDAESWSGTGTRLEGISSLHTTLTAGLLSMYIPGCLRNTYFQKVYLFLAICILILIKYLKIYLFSAKMNEKAKIREYLEKLFAIYEVSWYFNDFLLIFLHEIICYA